MKNLKNIFFVLYSLFSHKKVVVIRDVTTKMSFVYRNTEEADFVIKEQCDQNFNLSTTPDVEVKGLKGKLISKNLVLMVVDIHSALSNKILTVNEKSLIMNSFLNKNSDLLIDT
jgi:hypothetical protein